MKDDHVQILTLLTNQVLFVYIGTGCLTNLKSYTEQQEGDYPS